MTKTAYPRTPPPGLTALQTHVAFFDMNDDGYVTPEEFAQGLSDLGMPGSQGLLTRITKPILDAQAGLINDRLNAVSAPASIERATPTKIPVRSIGFGKHDSDTDSYVDDTGAFDQKKFDAMFQKADRNGSGSLDLSELVGAALGRAQGVKGLFASMGEFGLLWALGADVKESRLYGLLPDRNALSRERVKSALLGQGFYDIAESVAKKHQR